MRCCLAAAFALVALVSPVAAQETLVLSAGGARGIAHVGAVTGVERQGHDPDVVIGASMGAIVGALYSAGYAPDSLWSMVRNTHWDDLFIPVPVVLGPERVASAPMLQLGLEFGRFEVSRGFTPDWRVNRLLVHLLFDAGARTRGDFDRLTRRYRAVATDLATGKQVLLDHGDLARAVRASMAVPGFFSPVLSQDGKLLADGGIANYFPVSVARALHARSIIGVDVARLPPRIGRTDPVALGERAISLFERNALNDTIPPDILVVPDIDPDLSAADFEDPTHLYQLGLDAALKAVPRSAPPSTRRSLPNAPDSLAALKIEVDDFGLVAMALRIFASAAPAAYSADRVLAGVDRMYATGLVAGVWPRVEQSAGGAVLIVRLDPIPRTTGSGAAGYDNDRGGRIWGEVRRRRTFAGAPSDIALAGLANGLDRWITASARLQAIAWAPLAWTAGVYDSETRVRLFPADSSPPRQDIRRTGAWLGVEYPHFFPDWTFAALVRAEHVDVGRAGSGESAGPLVRLSSSAVQSVVAAPTELEAGVRFGDLAYEYFSVRAAHGAALDKLRVGAMVDLTLTSADAPPDVRRALGDASAFPGFRWGQERGQARLITGVDVAHPIPLQGFVRVRLRAGAAPDRLADIDPNTWVVGIALDGIWSTPFGNLLIGGGANSRGHTRIDVSLGPRF